MKAKYIKSIGQITVVCLALLVFVLPNQALAQFTGDYQTNIISGTAVNWPSTYYVGLNYFGNALFILNGGSLFSEGVGTGAAIGFELSSHDNLAVVSGSGSLWANHQIFYVGYYGSANQLVISDGGRVASMGQAVVGSQSSSISNSVLVTGCGSVWTNSSDLWMGDGGAYCSLVISNGGAVFDKWGKVGGNMGSGGRSNIALVTGSGSVWSNSGNMSVGWHGPGNLLVVSNGGTVSGVDGRIGEFRGAANSCVVVTGSGSLWKNSGVLFVGMGVPVGSGSSATNNRLTIADGGSVLASNAYVGLSYSSGLLMSTSNNLLHVSGGNLTVTNLSASGFLDVNRGALSFDSGTITVDRLWLTNGVNSILEFNSGTLHSKGTVISNTQPCIVGDGVATANFHLLGGVHSFQNGLRIRTNAFLTGCGTVNGSVVIEAGAAVHANCTNLVFNSTVTNNGAMVVDGAVLESFGTLVNNGTVLLLDSSTANFHGTFINNGQLFNGDIRLAIERDGSGGLFIHFTGAPDVTYRLQRSASVTGPWADLATNTAPASGLIAYHETSPPPGQSFYRTAQP
jgi:T5SS/PEP-CTERM-associated repeat protein